MRSAWSRRDVLASTTVSVLVAGCSSSRDADEPSTDVVVADRYDCDDVSRPEPDEPAVEDALDPYTYPARPASPSADAREYVVEFERAYRRNALLEEYGGETRAFEFDSTDWDTHVIEPDDNAEDATGADERDEDPILVAVVYDLSIETTVGEREEWDVRVTYYVDDDVVLRSRYDGIANDPEFVPDPRREGDPVACFGRS